MNMLISKDFWLKFIVIAFWSVLIGTFVFGMSVVPNSKTATPFDKWLTSIASTLIGGAGMNHIYNLYKVQYKAFKLDFAWPVFFLFSGLSLFAIGVLLTIGNNNNYLHRFGVIFSFLGVGFSIVGSDSGPEARGWNANRGR